MRWLRARNPAGASYYDEWERLLSGPLDALLNVVVNLSERACALRQESPFVDLVDQKERARIYREVSERFRSDARAVNREAVEHLLRAAAALTGESTFYVVGAAAILPSLAADADIPDVVRRSREADLIPESGSTRSIDLIDQALLEARHVDPGVLGERLAIVEAPETVRQVARDRLRAYAGLRPAE